MQKNIHINHTQRHFENNETRRDCNKVPKRQRICRILRIIIPNIDVCDLIRYNI